MRKLYIAQKNISLPNTSKNADSKELKEINFESQQKVKHFFNFSNLIFRSWVILLCVILCESGFAQSIFTNPITGTSITANPYATGQTLNANITSTGIAQGGGLSANGANNRYNVTGANSSSLVNVTFVCIHPFTGF